MIIANTIQFVIILPLERDLWMCADRNCPEWKALYTEARSWCFHHIIQVHTRNIDPTGSEYMRSAVRYAKTGRWSLALFPRLQFTHYRGVSAFHYDFNREQVSEKWAWSGYMITVSSIGDNQHCEVEVAARFLYEEQTDAVFFSGSSLCCSSRREP